jgi:hypothetical protein
MSDKKVVAALDLKFKVKSEDESLIDAIEKPVKNLFNTLKGFFTKKG